MAPATGRACALALVTCSFPWPCARQVTFRFSVQIHGAAILPGVLDA